MAIRIALLSAVVLLGATALVRAQRRDLPSPRRETLHAPWEFRAVLPQEVTPARYRQVSMAELEFVSREGWELVSATPYVYQNEERGPDGRKVVVTQAYPAYFFKRPRRE
jgi:hypothetical protein